MNVASLAGKVPVPHEAAYSASKAGLRAFSRALGVELAAHGVRVSCVNPGPVDTGFFGDVAGELAVDCLVPAGGAVIMRPLLLHASASATGTARRRVIHLEYAAEALPVGLEWYDYEANRDVTQTESEPSG